MNNKSKFICTICSYDELLPDNYSGAICKVCGGKMIRSIDSFSDVLEIFKDNALSKDKEKQKKAKRVADDFFKIMGQEITLRDKKGNIIWDRKKGLRR